MDTLQTDSLKDMEIRENFWHRILCCIVARLPMLLIGAALILVIIAGMIFFSQLIDNIKDTRVQVRRYETNRVSMLPYSCGHIEEDSPTVPFCKAYEELDRELTSWLTILTIAGALFGLIAPLVGYLLQHMKLEKERYEVQELIKETRADNDKMEQKMADIQKELQKGLRDVEALRDGSSKTIKIQTEQNLNECKRQIVAFTEYSIAQSINYLSVAHLLFDDSTLAYISNIIIAFDYFLDSLTHWTQEDVVKVRAKMLNQIRNMRVFWSKLTEEQRNGVHEILKKKFEPSGDFAGRNDFARILRTDSDDFKWLEKFFEPFAPWKFN